MNSNNNKVVLMSSKELKNEIQNMLIEQKKEILKELSKTKEKELFTRTELSKYLKVSQQTIINWSARGILNPRFIGSRVYYNGDEVRNLLNQ
jgi:DNA-binding transcriptional regulator YiaG